jgi:hypothetical protein
VAEAEAEAERLAEQIRMLGSASSSHTSLSYLQRIESLDNMYDEDVINDMGEDCREVGLEFRGTGFWWGGDGWVVCGCHKRGLVNVL